MARNKAQHGPTEVEAITHKETRANIPTADARDLVAPEVEEVVEVTYPREIRSPMLVWKGKEGLDDVDLQVEAPPIYIQEKIDPRVLIENLRKTAAAGDLEPERPLFDTFDGLSELDLVEFYKHSANWSNRMILGDSLPVMASLAERERLRGKVQMIYIDPPYGVKFGSNWQVSARKVRVTDGKVADIAREVEQIRAFRDTWELGIHSYLTYLRDRLEAARELLSESGSIFVQIGDENVHLVRSLLDEVMGAENACVEIVYQKTTGSGSRNESPTMLPAVADRILWYAKDRTRVKYRQLFRPKKRGGESVSLYTTVLLRDGTTRPLTKAEKSGGELPDGARVYGVGDLTSTSGTVKTRYPVTINGRTFHPDPGGWKTSREGMDRLVLAHRIHSGKGKYPGYIRFIDDFSASPITNVWTDTVGQNQFGGPKAYVVQTALKAVRRCLLMATDPGDLILDPTSGSGTTAVVAEQWGRRWIAIDTSRVAMAIARQRLMASRFSFYLLADSAEGRRKEAELSGSYLPPQETCGDVGYGFVYERIPHITLKSIANNPDIRQGMEPDKIDLAVRRHANHEIMFDQPYEDSKKVRVSGPFTVESLSPHRNLAGLGRTAESDRDLPPEKDSTTFEQTILENLRAAGVQNGRKSERLEFDLIESYAGKYVQAIGIREGAPEGAPKRVGVSIGPQNGTVAPSLVKNAAREASKNEDLDLLCILGFAFDPQVLNTDEDYAATDESFDVAGTRSLGRIPVLLVRMNSDLSISELKKTGAGNLFTVFGEPDLDICVDQDQIVVELLGVDAYDMATGEVRSGKTDKVALWMIDTDYDEESFFVRHCYFTGGQDPYQKLKRALNAEIDEDAWATLYSTVSRPFPKPSTGKIAVKVINDYGDEVVKVYDVS